MVERRRHGKGLSAAFVQSVQEPGKYHDGGGLGLIFRVDGTGRRFWVQRVTIRGKRRELGLGGYPLVKLADARETALDNKRLIRAGRDPLAEKRKAKAAAITFEQAARNAHAELSPTWKNPKDRAAFLATMETYCFPRFGAMRVADVTSAEVRQAILAAREKVPEVARKLAFRAAAVFRWAIAEGLRVDNPATVDALALPKVERPPVHRKALPYSEVSGCIEAVRASRASAAAKLALEFLILTCSRSGEVRGARWDECDLVANVWTVPASRMKMKRAHRVPLCARSLEILTEAEQLIDGSGLVFPSVRGKSLSDMTLSKLVKELGFAADVHGFRTSFRTWAQERTNFPREVCEQALAHVTGDAAERAYARSDVLAQRRSLMEAWASYLATRSGEVVVLRAGT